jgi:hypothetical protein
VLLGGLLLLRGTARGEGVAMVVGALGLGLVTLFGADGPDIGGGFVVLVCLAVLVVAGARLASAVAADRRR